MPQTLHPQRVEQKRKILGIDPGLATTGLGLVAINGQQELSALEWLTIQTKPGLPLAERLEEIERDLAAYVKKERPDLAVVEKLYFSTNVKTAIDVAHARGVILLTLAAHDIEVMEPNPLSLKSCITGDGHADKRQVQDMLCRTLNLAEAPKSDDAADALALAVFGALQRSVIKP
ncbi:crossover junction endodeoxyribonuclease RuvC [Candidatus Peregrinibacteria bacterium CG1_02_54_53]|nr:MAG: crossover junction endodeoxyribonuclease RuvC [Candidatus Peregrinibacteria bacterium CG1_02_54_53]